MGEIDILLTDASEARRESASPEDKIPESTPGLAVSRIGDLWELGQHRLLCGDARDEGIDVAIRRWQSYTRRSAKLAGTNKTFEEIEKERTSVELVPDIASDQAASANHESV
jgi:hypothetical protein